MYSALFDTFQGDSTKVYQGLEKEFNRLMDEKARAAKKANKAEVKARENRRVEVRTRVQQEENVLLKAVLRKKETAHKEKFKIMQDQIKALKKSIRCDTGSLSPTTPSPPAFISPPSDVEGSK